MTALPFVSCICPTGNRRIWLERAVSYFERQSYPSQLRELVIIDGGDTAALPIEAFTFKERSLITYRKCDPHLTVGERRNLAISLARGPVIAHWDDDDWYSPLRLEKQVETFVADEPRIIGIAAMWAYDFVLRRGWDFFPGCPLPAGNVIMYPRALWERQPFPPLNYGEDAEFLAVHKHQGFAFAPSDRLVVYIRHPRNQTPQISPVLDPSRTNVVRGILGSDVDFYDRLAELFPAPRLESNWHLPPRDGVFRASR